MYWAKGAARQAAQSPGAPVRMVVVDIKNGPVGALENKTGAVSAFPRPGSRKLFENDLVVVWDYTFMSGTPSPMHFHDKDVVVTYMADGALKSTTPDGQSQTNENSFGLTKFNARNRTHTEQLVSGKSRVIAVELK